MILRKTDFSEADRIMTLFTLEKGKVRAIAKGVRKAKSRMSGSLDVFAHGRMMLAEGRNLDVITQFQRITDTGPLSGDLARSAAGAVMVEVADKVLEERHPQPDLFGLVVSGLGHLADLAVDPRAETADFLMRVLAELGYAPELRVCARCGRELEGGRLAFSAVAGGVIGPECDQGSPAITVRAVKILRVMAAGDRAMFLRLQLEEADLRAVEAALESQLEHHLDRQLKSIDFARRIRR